MEWTYSGINGPENWFLFYTAASGCRQSPIDIQPEKTKSVEYRQTFKIDYFNAELRDVKNTGHGWHICANSSELNITGGPLIGDYELIQIHAHWGADDSHGSEHTINGCQYSGELHLVHWNKTKYATFEEATKHADGLCVLAVLLKAGNSHSELEKIVDVIPKIHHRGDSCQLKSSINPKFMLPSNLEYWTYMGSLTTPPCSECVIWMVFNEPIDISHDQLEAFRTLRCHSNKDCDEDCCCEDQTIHNYRPTLPLGDRTVFSSSSDCNFRFFPK